MAAALNRGLPDAEFEAMKAKLWSFMKEDIYPNEKLFEHQSRAIGATNEWHDPPILTKLKEKAKSLGLWNLWLSTELGSVMGMGAGYSGAGLSNLQYVCGSSV